METAAIVLLSICWFGLIVACAVWLAFMIREPDAFGICFSGFTLLLLIGLTLGYLSSVQEDKRNPCVAWGPPVTTYVMVGKVLTPITTTPCTQRQNETEK